jgi:hypothetical protein
MDRLDDGGYEYGRKFDGGRRCQLITVLHLLPPSSFLPFSYLSCDMIVPFSKKVKEVLK